MATTRSAFGPIRFGLLVLAGVAASRGEVVPARVFGDRMVLQRDRSVPVWGTAAADEEVTVEFADQRHRAVADGTGRWRVYLDPLAASFAPRVMRIAGRNVLTFSEVLVGEVWLCSGQSNMEYPASRPFWGQAIANADPRRQGDPATLAELAKVDLPAVRLFRVHKKLGKADVVSDGWTECRGQPLTLFSAIGFFFARELQPELRVPVGVIQAAWGGTRIERFTPPSAFTWLPAFAAEMSRTPPTIDGLKELGSKYRGFIEPLAPYALRGVLWYQGESNVNNCNDGARYPDKMQALVEGWRAAWENPELSFHSVQLVPYSYAKRKDGPVALTTESLPEFWEGQFLAQRIPGVWLVPSIDQAEDLDNAHPRAKAMIAHRLASQVLAKSYRRPAVATGPVFAKLSREGDALMVDFDGVGSGLVSRDGLSLTNFEVAGDEGRFVSAEAKIENGRVAIRSAAIAEPTQVRFAWREDAQPNLMNREGWPAYPFRSRAPDWQPAPVRAAP